MMLPKHFRRVIVAIFFATLVIPPRDGKADDSQWNWLADTEWYVPAANLLAYFTSVTDLSDNVPVADQTIWDITTSSNGVFSGTAQATFVVLGESIVSNSAVTGFATEEGQIRMIFTPDSGGEQTVGIGQFRDLGLPTQQMEMQMLSTAGDFYVTHWAYMTEVPDGEFTPPTEIPPGTLLSQEWIWTDGTTWSLTAPGLFGTSDPGQFSIDSYVNGYFWGTGIGPASTGSTAFSHIASITPEGNVLLNILLGDDLVNLTGQIGGDASDGTMLLRGYTGTDDFGDAAVASIVPEPSVVLLFTGAGLFLLLNRRRMHQT